MKITALIKELERIKAQEGDIEVTCTGCIESEKPNPMLEGGPYETTVENLVIQAPTEKWTAKRVRLYW